MLFYKTLQLSYNQNNIQLFKENPDYLILYKYCICIKLIHRICKLLLHLFTVIVNKN
jgi:hypothetical protein